MEMSDKCPISGSSENRGILYVKLNRIINETADNETIVQ